MKKYDKTQETGIFFNQIPAHWEIKRGKDVIEILSGYPFASELFDIDALPALPTPITKATFYPNTLLILVTFS
jgi:hypothetical protein